MFISTNSTAWNSSCALGLENQKLLVSNELREHQLLSPLTDGHCQEILLSQCVSCHTDDLVSKGRTLIGQSISILTGFGLKHCFILYSGIWAPARCQMRKKMIAGAFALLPPLQCIIMQIQRDRGCFGFITDSGASLPLSYAIPATLHQGTGAIERQDNTVLLLGAELYLIQF